MTKFLNILEGNRIMIMKYFLTWENSYYVRMPQGTEGTNFQLQDD